MPQQWNAQQLIDVTGGHWLRPPAGDRITPSGWSLDTRSLKPGEVFLAFAGQKVDGHAFVGDAARAGACLIVVERDVPLPESAEGSAVGGGLGPSGSAVLRVDSTEQALQRLAVAWRKALDQSKIVLIAVTGSNGKTTQRNMIHAALATGRRGRQAIGSFNNHLGVPLTVLTAQPEDDYLVLELGMNHRGEIKKLATIARPHIGVITSIGSAHLGLMGSREAIAEEKASLLDGLEPHPRTGRALGLVPRSALRPWTDRSYPPWLSLETTPEPDGLEVDADGTALGLDGQPCRVPLIGSFIADYTWNAWRIGDELGLTTEAVIQGLQLVQPMPMRLEIRRLPVAGLGDDPDQAGELELILDCYNAGPESMRHAVALLGRRPWPAPGHTRTNTPHRLSEAGKVANPQNPPAGCLPGGGPAEDFGRFDGAAERGLGADYEHGASGRRIAILGDMLELESFSQREHRLLGEFVAGCSVDVLIAVGAHSRDLAESAGKSNPGMEVHWLERADAGLLDALPLRWQAGDIVLIKGSRGVRMERIAQAIDSAVRIRSEVKSLPSQDGS